VMSGWPWYIAEAAAVGLALLYVVAALTDAIRRRVEADAPADDRR
jgi:hypothetical protein